MEFFGQTMLVGLLFLLGSFDVEALAWRSTHVVVVSSDSILEGEVRVLESIRGDLSLDRRILVGELTAFAPEAERAVGGADGPEPGEPCYVSGRRILLFLRTSTVASPTEQRRGLSLAQQSDFGMLSLAWLEEGIAFAYVQYRRPGPRVLVPVGSEQEVLERARASAHRRDNYDAVLAIPSAQERARELLSFLDQPESQDYAMEALGACGTDAVPHLARILDDPEQAELWSGAMQALICAGGVLIAPELRRLAEFDLAFWMQRGPSLAPGWWNGEGVDWSEVTDLRSHYCRLLYAVRGLGEVGHSSSRSTIEQVLTLWRSLPQLAHTEMIEACEEALTHLAD